MEDIIWNVDNIQYFRQNLSYLDPGSISIVIAAIASAFTSGYLFFKTKFFKTLNLIKKIFKRN